MMHKIINSYGKGTNMSEPIELIRSQLQQVVHRMCDIADGNLTADPIKYEELKTIANDAENAMHEVTDPKSMAFLDLVKRLIVDMQHRTGRCRVFQFQVSLHGDNRVWKRIQIPDQELSGLVEALLDLGNWDGDDSYSLEMDGGSYAHPDEVCSWQSSLEDFTIYQTLGRPPVYGRLVRWGQDWLDLVYEGDCYPERGQQYPRCIDGRGTFPAEEEMCKWVRAMRETKSLITEPTDATPRTTQPNAVEARTGSSPDTSSNT